MPTSQSPLYTQTPRFEITNVSTANANKDGTGSISLLISAGQNGTLIESINIKSLVTTTAGMIRLFHLRSGIYRLIDEFEISAITVSASVAGYEYTKAYTDYSFILPFGDSLYVSTEKSESVNVYATGGDF